MNAAEIAQQLDGKREGKGWRSLCPAHDDHEPSLSIIQKNGKILVTCRAGCAQDAVIAALRERGLWPSPGNGHDRDPVAVYDYRDESDRLLFQVCRFAGKKFRQRRPDRVGGWIWNLGDVRRVLYRLPELVTAPLDQIVYVPEGEKDVDALVEWNRVATTNPGGAGKWRYEYAQYFTGRDVVVIPDPDKVGRDHAAQAAVSLRAVAKRVRIIELPGGDFSKWVAAGGTPEQLDALVSDNKGLSQENLDRLRTPDPRANEDEDPGGPKLRGGVSLKDFYAYMPKHQYIYIPSRDLWPAESINGRFPKIQVTPSITISPAKWLDRHRPVEQMTWAPGEPLVIHDRLINEGGWLPRRDARCFNLYLPSTLPHGDATKAGPWLDHVRLIYPENAEHITCWLAHRVQRPAEKINHAIILSGASGIGKDTLLEPIKQAVGPWNFREASPIQVMDRYNGFLKGVILRISEIKDLGESDRYKSMNT